MVKEKIKNLDDQKSEEVAKTENSDTKMTEKVAEEPKISFEFSDKDIQDFKEWKKLRELKTSVTAPSPEDDKVRRAWKEESRMVKGVFRCREPEGGNVEFFFKKYKWDPVQHYVMFDGEVYEVPLAVARHLNKNCNYPIHSHILGPDGRPTIDRTGKVKSRMNFESTEFVNI